jgi:uncharacterized YigZ family protein
MVTAFNTIKNISEGRYKEKGSKFIAIAYPVNNLSQINGYLTDLRKKYHDARHYCYAYILGPEARDMRANDDGEPSHSAGDPILGQIKSFTLTNTLVVVVRYFGGTKLGVSGLIQAYKTASREALLNNKIITREVTMGITLVFPYASTNEAMKLITDMDIHITTQTFDANCEITGKVAIKNQEFLKKKIDLLQNLGVKIKVLYN